MLRRRSSLVSRHRQDSGNRLVRHLEAAGRSQVDSTGIGDPLLSQVLSLPVRDAFNNSRLARVPIAVKPAIDAADR